MYMDYTESIRKNICDTRAMRFEENKRNAGLGTEEGSGAKCKATESNMILDNI